MAHEVDGGAPRCGVVLLFVVGSCQWKVDIRGGVVVWEIIRMEVSSDSLWL